MAQDLLSNLRSFSFDMPLPQNLLNIEEKNRNNLFAWRGQFSPQLVEALLHAYAPENSTVLDPFVGSGTTLYEAAKIDLPAMGLEINPAALIFANVFELANIDADERTGHIQKVEEFLFNLLLIDFPLIGDNSHTRLEINEFASKSRREADQYTKYLIEALLIGIDFGRFETISSQNILNAWLKLRNIVLDLPTPSNGIQAIMADARNMPIKDDTIDVVITSPPYINVFNYHQNYRSSAEYLGWKLLSVAKSEIGANRKFRQNRFMTVIQYCLDLALVFNEIKRVCKDTSNIIFVVGKESNVRKTPFYNGQILTKLAAQCADLDLVQQQSRVFTNRFGQRIYEEILHFTNKNNETMSHDEILQKSYSVAMEVLGEAIDRAPEESREDIHAAIGNLRDVSPSPFFSERNSNINLIKAK